MTDGKVPRVVIVTRPTELELLLAHHATRGQARFFLEQRGQKLEQVEQRHALQDSALRQLAHAIPGDWRQTQVRRDDLDRFVFEPDDLVAVVGQDGLVANVAKYLTGQLVIGLNPDAARNDGVLVPHPPARARELLLAAAARRVEVERRSMDDGQHLTALNEVFVGHRTHQSARYVLGWHGQSERQSSSGAIVTTGTGATGWAKSIANQRSDPPPLPSPVEPRLAFFVREAFPSVSTGVSLTQGVLEAGDQLSFVSEMNEGGVVFGDGIEQDALSFAWGMKLDVRVSDVQLCVARSC
jgi:NAD kinase